MLKRLPGVINELGWGQCLYGGASAYMVTLQSRNFEQLATIQCTMSKFVLGERFKESELFSE